MRQKIRREFIFGLIPKTLQGTRELFDNLLIETLDGDEQVHPVYNALNILSNKGFLREEGIYTLEAVQIFDEENWQTPGKPTLKNQDVLDFCPMGNSVPEFKAVITLVKKSSENLELSYHVDRVFTFYVSFFDQE